MTVGNPFRAVRRIRVRVGSGAPDVVENPVTGERIQFRTRPDGSVESTLRFDYYLAPAGFAVGTLHHVHPGLEERIDVRAGRLGVRLDGDEWSATPGTRFSVPPKTPHTLWNDGEEPVHAVIELAPGLAIESFFETMYGLARDGQIDRWGLPGPLQSAVLLDAFRDEFAFAGVPIGVQRVIAGAIAPVGRRLGYRARCPGGAPGSIRRA